MHATPIASETRILDPTVHVGYFHNSFCTALLSLCSFIVIKAIKDAETTEIIEETEAEA